MMFLLQKIYRFVEILYETLLEMHGTGKMGQYLATLQATAFILLMIDGMSLLLMEITGIYWILAWTVSSMVLAVTIFLMSLIITPLLVPAYGAVKLFEFCRYKLAAPC